MGWSSTPKGDTMIRMPRETVEVEVSRQGDERPAARVVRTLRRILRVCGGCCYAKVYDSRMSLGFIVDTTHGCPLCGGRMGYVTHKELQEGQ